MTLVADEERGVPMRDMRASNRGVSPRQTQRQIPIPSLPCLHVDSRLISLGLMNAEDHALQSRVDLHRPLHRLPEQSLNDVTLDL